jgi:hypothetical protein
VTFILKELPLFSDAITLQGYLMRTLRAVTMLLRYYALCATLSNVLFLLALTNLPPYRLATENDGTHNRPAVSWLARLPSFVKGNSLGNRMFRRSSLALQSRLDTLRLGGIEIDYRDQNRVAREVTHDIGLMCCSENKTSSPVWGLLGKCRFACSIRNARSCSLSS